MWSGHVIPRHTLRNELVARPPSPPPRRTAHAVRSAWGNSSRSTRGRLNVLRRGCECAQCAAPELVRCHAVAPSGLPRRHDIAIGRCPIRSALRAVLPSVSHALVPQHQAVRCRVCALLRSDAVPATIRRELRAAPAVTGAARSGGRAAKQPPADLLRRSLRSAFGGQHY